jgi:hypothetical protein
LRGTLDYDNEIVHTLRGRGGSPGVNILTPLRRVGNDTAVLVNRGWLYAPDGITVDTKPWREARISYSWSVCAAQSRAPTRLQAARPSGIVEADAVPDCQLLRRTDGFHYFERAGTRKYAGVKRSAAYTARAPG